MGRNSFWDGKMHVTKINNRRYLGNKYRLLPFINDVIAKEYGIAEIIKNGIRLTSAST